jgi:hypothetical protein
MVRSPPCSPALARLPAANPCNLRRDSIQTHLHEDAPIRAVKSVCRLVGC